MPYVGREANSFTTVVDVTVSDDLTVTDDATIGGALAVTGNVLVGKTSANIATVGHEINGNGSYASHTRSGNTCLFLNRTTSDGDIAVLRKDGSTMGSIGSYGSGSGMYLGTGDTGIAFNSTDENVFPRNPSTNAPRDNAIDLGSSSARFKDLYLSGGAFLGGTGAANKLDDYEEGTFTPTITGGTSNPTLTYVTQVGKYTKVGNLVRVTIYIETSAFSGGGGNLQFSGLPFTSVNATATASQGSIAFYKVNSHDAENSAYVGTNSSIVTVLGRSGSAASDGWSALAIGAWTNANTTAAQFSVTYFT